MAQVEGLAERGLRVVLAELAEPGSVSLFLDCILILVELYVYFMGCLLEDVGIM